jgi:hypothetical protein
VAGRDTPPRSAASRAISQFVGVEFRRSAGCALGSGLGREPAQPALRSCKLACPMLFVPKFLEQPLGDPVLFSVVSFAMAVSSARVIERIILIRGRRGPTTGCSGGTLAPPLDLCVRRQRSRSKHAADTEPSAMGTGSRSLACGGVAGSGLRS